ncbi:hypothetical protein V1264_002592 [Littorina saxatilis]|uniref:Uncharacterized protein n=1 Tax=Littorina saxatilis TaxID=31220 RepID=A0AAN9G7Y9_9CAEN
MLGLVLVITAASITCVSSCTFTGKVDMTSDKLLVTCRCETSRHERLDRIVGISIFETYHQRSFLLARHSLRKKFPGNFLVESSQGWSDGIPVLSLSFNPRREYNFTCVVQHHDYDYGLADSAFELLYDPSEYLITHQKYPQMLIISIVTACSIIIVVTIIAIVIAKYRRPATPAPTDAVSLEVVNSLLTSPDVRSIRPVTPSPSREEYLPDGSYVSGTCVSCHSEASSLYDRVPPSPPDEDVTAHGENDAASDATRANNVMTSQRHLVAIQDVNRRLPPIPGDQHFPPPGNKTPRLTSPVNPQLTADVVVHPLPLSPPSLELTSLPIAPRLPVGEQPLPAVDGYIDMASAPSQDKEGYLTPVHRNVTDSPVGTKPNSRGEYAEGDQHRSQPTDPNYLTHMCEQKQDARGEYAEGGQHRSQPTDPNYLTHMCEQKQDASGEYAEGGQHRSQPTDPNYLTHMCEQKQDASGEYAEGGQHRSQPTDPNYLTHMCEQKQDASGEYAEGGQHRSQPTDPNYLTHMCEQKQDASGEYAEGGQHRSQPTDPNYLTPMCEQKQDARGEYAEGGQHRSQPTDPNYLTPLCEQKQDAKGEFGEGGTPVCNPTDPNDLTPASEQKQMFNLL